ncbi:ParM/StbA family protein [Alkalinema pantanalense CENA528]|uniref:ParM/StbA family protein n=1 Tax=Alkalinema pantanalense TaxID=1620705 RepID=UPI003D6F432E
MQVQTQNQTVTAGSINQFQPFGADIGNGAIKLVSANGETRTESYIYYLSERASNPGKGYVEYIEGDRGDLVGKQWVGGINAYYFAPTSIYRVTDSKEGKVELGLQVLLSALSELPYRPTWDIALAVSVHDGKTLGKLLRNALEGVHGVRLAGKASRVNIRVVGVLEEGSGAIVHYAKTIDTTNAILYDLGNGTLIVSHFSGLQLTNRTYSQNGGVERLIDEVAKHDTVRQELLKEGQRHLIRKGIESGGFTYGTQKTGWTFETAYRAELPIWVRDVLTPMVRPTEAHFDAATALIAVGGGACLPGIDKLLAKKNIRVLADPQWANARGLYQYATRKLTQERIGG